MKKLNMLVAMIALATPLGYSQSTGSGTANSTAGSSSQVNAPITITTTGATQHQLVQAPSGPQPGMFPGNALGPGVCTAYHPKVKNLKYLSTASIDAMAKGVKLPHGVKPTLIDPKEAKATSYDGPIGVMEYDPTGDAVNDGDITLAGITMPGKPFEVNEALLGATAKALKKVAPAMERVAVFNCYIFDEVTDTTSKGIGATVSGTNGTGQIGGSGSIGWFKGTSSTEQQRHVVTTVYAVNGPYNLLTPPAPEPKKGDDATVKQPPPVVQPPPAPIQQAEVTPTPAPVPPPTPVVAITAPDECKIPEVSVYFAFDYPKVSEGPVMAATVMTGEGSKDNAGAIRTMQQWLEEHPTCKIDVVGYTCFRASNKYNNDLGERRADAVLRELRKDEKIRDQVFEADSNGKENAATSGSKEHNWHDRRVSFRVRGSDSAGR